MAEKHPQRCAKPSADIRGCRFRVSSFRWNRLRRFTLAARSLWRGGGFARVSRLALAFRLRCLRGSSNPRWRRQRQQPLRIGVLDVSSKVYVGESERNHFIRSLRSSELLACCRDEDDHRRRKSKGQDNGATIGRAQNIWTAAVPKAEKEGHREEQEGGKKRFPGCFRPAGAPFDLGKNGFARADLRSPEPAGFGRGSGDDNVAHCWPILILGKSLNDRNLERCFIIGDRCRRTEAVSRFVGENGHYFRSVLQFITAYDAAANEPFLLLETCGTNLVTTAATAGDGVCDDRQALRGIGLADDSRRTENKKPEHDSDERDSEAGTVDEAVQVLLV